MIITPVTHDERKPRGENAALVARLIETGETLLVEEANAQGIYTAGRKAGVTVHISKRESGFVVWVDGEKETK